MIIAGSIYIHNWLALAFKLRKLLLQRCVRFRRRVNCKAALLHRAHAVAAAIDDIVHRLVAEVYYPIFRKTCCSRLADNRGINLCCTAVNHQHRRRFADYFIGDHCAAQCVVISLEPAEQGRDSACFRAQERFAFLHNTG